MNSVPTGIILRDSILFQVFDQSPPTELSFLKFKLFLGNCQPSWNMLNLGTEGV